MLRFTHVLLAIYLSITLANAIVGQDLPGDDSPPDPVATSASDTPDAAPDDELSPAIAPVDASTNGEQASPTKETPTEETSLSLSLIVSVRTNNGFTIYGIPSKPIMLPINLYGADVKIPWNDISTVQFTENGGIAVALEDGSRLIGYSMLEYLELDKEWGRIRIPRHLLQAIRRNQTESTLRSSDSLAPRGIPARQ